MEMADEISRNLGALRVLNFPSVISRQVLYSLKKGIVLRVWLRT